MKQLLFFFLSFVFFSVNAQETPFEKSNGNQTATYSQAMKWYGMMDIISSKIKVKEMGPTDAGFPLKLVLASNTNQFDPVTWHKQKKVIILINNGIHPGEPDGIDASMMLARDIATGKFRLPDNVVLAFIPVYNIGGMLNRNVYTRVNQNGPEEYGFRGNAQNLDLNRDFTKCDSKEAKSFAEIFHWLDPDILIDNHVSDGADYQHTMTLISTQYEKLGPVLGKWLKEKFEPAIYSSMAKKKWELIPYVDFDASNFDKGIRMFYDPPRYSTGYAALFNTISFMPETHMLKPYKERVLSTYDLMVSFIEQSSLNAAELLQKRAEAKKQSLSTTAFALKWVSDTSSFKEIIFKGYKRDTTLSEATGLQKMFYNHQLPFTQQVKYFNTFKPVDVVKKPTAYIIPQGWYAVVELLKLNGVKVEQLKRDTRFLVTAYHIDSYKSMASPYEKHHKNHNVQVTASQKEMNFLEGDYSIVLDQPVNRYIVEMLEPTGEDSFFAWNFFDAILQQKEGYSDYRWEDIATEVLKNDASLQQKLTEKKAADPAFAQNSKAILDFIYRNSPYYEKAYLQYPVYRMEE